MGADQLKFKVSVGFRVYPVYGLQSDHILHVQ
jgi:hypothetical protein